MGLQVKQFVFELLVIDLLEGKEDLGLDIQLKHVWGASEGSGRYHFRKRSGKTQPETISQIF